MRKLFLALALALNIACVHPTPAPPPQPPPDWHVDVVALCGSGPCAGASIQLHYTDGYHLQTANADGYTLWTVPATLVDSDTIIDMPGYVIFQSHIDVAGTHDGGHNIFHLTPLHVDPSGIPLETLAAIRGSMWSARGNFPYGPRPGQDSNILAMDFYGLYDAPTQARMLTEYTAYGYTHAVVGPLSGTDCYHSQYPCHDASNPGSFPEVGSPAQYQWDYFLDRMQEWWDAGIAPVFFIHPDNWTFEQTRDAFTPLLQQPRAQKLLRIVVPSGWEPTRYGWSSCTWARYAQWARATLPNALVLIHTVNDVDAPVGTDALCDDNGKPNGDGWARVVPFIHGWLIQNGPYASAPAGDPQLAVNFAAQFMSSGEGAVQHSIAWHFAGNAGWPTFSAWGNTRIKLYNAENTSYNAYWHNLPMAWSQAWGDLAVQSGADGYLDSGTVSVGR